MRYLAAEGSPTAVQVVCPNTDCGATYSVSDEWIGRTGRCKRCGLSITIPDSADGSPPPTVSRAGVDVTSSFSGQSTSAGAGLGVGLGVPGAVRAVSDHQAARPRRDGTVYLAHDTKLDRRVALKIPHFAPDEGSAAREPLYREARAAATFDHPNLCPVYDVGEVDGVDYLTMPYLEGKPLSAVIDPDKPAVPRQVAAVVRKLALALEVAHRRGVVHRDLKPANIMASRSRELVIMDFGLARCEDSGDARLTRTGVVMGTPAYMPPEQAAGELDAIGPRSDIYSLGVIMYELLTGRRPIKGPPSKVLGLIMVADPPRPTSHRPDLDPRIEAICLKAMAKEPNHRHASMAELAAELADYLARPSAAPAAASAPAQPARAPSSSASSRSGEDTLAARFFSGLVTEDESDLVLAIRPPRKASGFRKPPRQVLRTAAAAGAALVPLGIIIYVVMDKGTVKIEADDPRIVVRLEGEEIRVDGLGEPIPLRVGKHTLVARYGDGTVESQDFTINRVDEQTVRFKYVPKAARAGLAARPKARPDDDPPASPGATLVSFETPDTRPTLPAVHRAVSSVADGMISPGEYGPGVEVDFTVGSRFGALLGGWATRARTRPQTT